MKSEQMLEQERAPMSADDLFADIPVAGESSEASALFADIGVANPSTGFAGDMGRLVGVGLNRTASAAGMAMEQLGAEKAGQWIQEKTDTRADELMNQLSPEQQQAMQKKYTEKADGTKGFGEAWTDPRTTLGHVAMSAPMMVPGMGMGAVATKGLSVLPWLAKLGAKGRTIAAAVGYGAGEGAIAGGIAGKDIVEEIRGASFEQLAQLEPFQQAYHSITDENMSHAEKLELAREKIASAAYAEVTGKVAAVTGILSSPTGIIFDRMARGIGFGAKSRPKLKDIPKYAAGEAAQEFPQEGSESYLSDSALQKYVDPTIDPKKNVIESATAGAAAGGFTGGIIGAGTHGAGRVRFAGAQRRLVALNDELFDDQGRIRDGADSARIVEYLDLAGAAREQWGDEGAGAQSEAVSTPTPEQVPVVEEKPSGPLEKAVTMAPDSLPPVVETPPLTDADVPNYQQKLGQVFPGEKVPNPVQQPKVDIYKKTSTVGMPQAAPTQQEQTNDLSEMPDVGIEAEETLQGLRSQGSGVSDGGNAGDKKEGSKGASRTVKASTVPNLEQYDGPNAQQEEPILAQLRGQGNQGSPEAGRVQGVSRGGRGAPESSASTGQDQQQRELRARESSVGNEEKAGSQYAEESPFGGEGGDQTVGGVGRNSRLGSEYNPLSAIDGDVSRGGDIYSGKGELEAATKTDESKDLTSKEVFSQQKKVQQDSEQAPDVVMTTTGNPFITEAKARQVINKLGLAESHEVVAASEVQAGAQGFVGRKKTVADKTTNEVEKPEVKAALIEATNGRGQVETTPVAETVSVKKNAAEAYLEALRRDGEMEVTFPEDVAEQIKKHTGVDIEVNGEKIKIKEVEKAEPAVGIAVALNAELNGIEITFPEKPTDEVREKLKGHSFRWNRKKGIWYAKQSPARLAFAEGLRGAAKAEAGQEKGITVGKISDDVGAAIRREAAEIRLRKGDDSFGEAHIDARHGEDIRALGYDSVKDFVRDIVDNFNAIFPAKGGALDLVVTRGKLKFARVRLEPSDDGAFYDIKTATPGRNDQYKNKKPLWESAGPSVSDAEASPLIPGAQVTSSSKSITPEGAEVKKPTDTYGASNKLVSADRADELRKKLRAKLNQVNSGIDPEMLAMGTELAVYHIEAGARSFARFARVMVEDLGDKAKPFLKSWYMGAKNWPGMDKAGMDSEGVVDAAQVDDIIEETQAEGVADEQVPASSNELSGKGESEGVATDAAGAGSGGVSDGRGAGVRPAGGSDLSANDGKPAKRNLGKSSRTEKLSDDSDGSDAGRPERISQGDTSRRLSPPDYRISETDKLGEGGAKTKARDNIAAIRLIQQIQQEQRPATKEEQAVLVKYVGWGSSELANGMFPKREWDSYAREYKEKYKDGWESLSKELRELLDDKAFAAAQRSTQNAHYTSPAIIKGMYEALQRFGFTGGRLLEPGAGIGHFIGLLPDALVGSRFTSVELDTTSAAIAKALYPGHDVRHADFAEFKAPNGFYDVAIGNPPFADIEIVSDPDYAKQRLKLHDFFFVKALDKVRPGGVMLLVTSRYTMDKVNDRARKLLAKQADLLGAIRLPQTAFKENAGTDVVTDVLFLRKRLPGEAAAGEDWSGLKEVLTKEGQSHWINEYFANNSEMVLGEHSLTGSMYGGNQYTVLPKPGAIADQFMAAVDRLPTDVYAKADTGVSTQQEADIQEFAPQRIKEGAFYLDDKGNLLSKENGVGVKSPKSGRSLELVKGFIGVRDAVRQVLYVQVSGEGDLQAEQKTLHKAYDAFVKKFGPINRESRSSTMRNGEERVTVRYPNFQHFKADPDAYLVAAIEHYNSDNGEASKADIFDKRVISPVTEPKIETLSDALHVSLHETGGVSVARIAELMSVTEEQAIAGLGEAIYKDPEQQAWVTDDEYLSGNVRDKLAAALSAAEIDAAYQRNVDALKTVQPEDLPPSRIKLALGMPLLDAEHVEGFAREVIGLGLEVTHLVQSGDWSVKKVSGYATAAATSDYGTDRMDAAGLIDAALNSRQVRINDYVDNGSGGTKPVLNKDATEAANAKLQKIKDRFSSWVWENTERAEMLARRYNELYNNMVPRVYGGDHISKMQFPGMSSVKSPREHQRRVAWRIVQKGNTYMAHSVGAGKTIASILAGQEMKRLGIKKKPTWLVPNHMLKQFAAEFLELYPAAKILVADEEQFSKENRNRFMGRIAAENWDGIIITHSAFKKIPMSAEFQEQFIQEQLDELDDLLTLNKGDRAKVKQIERQKQRLEQRLKKILDSSDKDKGVQFEETGIDMLLVDEAHEFRKLDFATNQTNIKGVDPNGSLMAFDLYVKSRYLESLYPDRSLVLMSGTPLTNTIGEVYSIQRFLQEKLLIKLGLHNFDAWASTFGEMVTELEATPAGTYKPVTRFAKFKGLAALSSMWGDIGDFVHARDLPYIKRPLVEGGGRQIVVGAQSELQKMYKQQLGRRIKAIEKRSGPPKKGDDIILNVITDGRHAALDDRYISPGAEADPDSKIAKLLNNVMTVWDETKATKGTQMIFSDLGVPSSEARRGFSAYTHIRDELVRRGVPAAEIAFMQDYKKSDQKLKLFKAMNRGDVRVLIGSSAAMGTGVNAQERLFALHHLDPDSYLPSWIEQREGRIVRQGNTNGSVRLYAYVTKGSYDETMWQFLETKQRFIDQFLAGRAAEDEATDIDGSADMFAMARAMSSDNPLVLEKAGVENDINRLEALYRAHMDDQSRLARSKASAEKNIIYYKKMISKLESAQKIKQDTSGKNFAMEFNKARYDERAKAGEGVLAFLKDVAKKRKVIASSVLGKLGGFDVVVDATVIAGKPNIQLSIDGAGQVLGQLTFSETGLIEADEVGLIMRLENMLREIDKGIDNNKKYILRDERTIEESNNRIGRKFEHADALDGKRQRLDEINRELARESKDEDSKSDDGSEMAESDDAPRFSVRSERSIPLTDVEFEAVFARITARSKNREGFVIAPTARDLPAAIRTEIEKQGHGYGDIDGVFHRGKVYIVREHIASVAQLEEVLFHEWHGHAGLMAMMGNDGKRVQEYMLELYDMIPPGDMLKMARKHDFNLTKYAQGLRKAGHPAEVRHAMLMEEMLAHLTREFSSGKVAVKIKEIIGMVRAWLRRNGFMELAELSESDIALLLKKARAFAEAGTWAKDPGFIQLQGQDLLNVLKKNGVTEEMLRGALSGLYNAGQLATAGVESRWVLNPNDDPAVMERMKGELYVPERLSERAYEGDAGTGREAAAESVARGSLRAVRQVREISKSTWPEGEYRQVADQILRPAEAQDLKTWAEKEGLMLDNDQFNSSWQAGGKKGGTEHDVYFNESDKRWYKRQRFTMSDTFTDYFQRIILTNYLNQGIGDYRLEGFVENNGQLQPVVSQAHIREAGDHPTVEEVNAFMKKAGFERVDKGGPDFMGQFRIPGEDYIVSDHYKGNAVRVANGRIALLDPLIKPDIESKRDRIEAAVLADKYGIDARFMLREKSERKFLSRMTMDTKGIPWEVLAGLLPDRVREAIGSVLSNPHWGSKDSKDRSKVYNLAVERADNKAEMDHDIISPRADGYRGKEGFDHDWRKMKKKSQRKDVARLLERGDIDGVEYTREQLSGKDNPLGRPADKLVIDGYLAFRETINYSTEVLFDRMGRLRLVPFEGESYYDELIALLDDKSLTKDDVARRYGLNMRALGAYRGVKAGEDRLNTLTAAYRNEPYYDALREMLVKGWSKNKVLSEHGVSNPYLVEIYDKIMEAGDIKITSAASFKDKSYYKELIELINAGEDHPMLRKLELYQAYSGLVDHSTELAKLRNEWNRRKGYLPRMRKEGEQHVRIKGPDSDGVEQVLWMQATKTKGIQFDIHGKNVGIGAERLKAAIEKDIKSYIPHSYDAAIDAANGYTVVIEPSKATSEEIFAGLGSHAAMEAIIAKALDAAESAGTIDSKLKVQKHLLNVLADDIAARGFGKHRINRAGHLIEGYEVNQVRDVLTQYIGSMTGWLSKAEFSLRAQKAVAEIPPENQSDVRWATKYVNDALKNSTYLDQWAGTARSFATLWYLGVKVSTLALNATQNYTMGIPVLSKYTKGAARKMIKAQYDMMQSHYLKATGKKNNLTEEEQWAIDQGQRRRRTTANYVRALSGLDDTGGAMGRGQAGLRWATEKSMVPFQAVESYFNREPALLAAYRVFRNEHKLSKEQALAKAEEFVDDVHFRVSKENIPEMLRKFGPAGRMIYTFQSFTHNYILGMLYSLKKGEFGVVMRSLTALMLLGGMAALPFGSDLDKWYRKYFGERPLRMLDQWLRETTNEYTNFGDQIADFVMHGVPALAGVNFSGSLGVSIPWFTPEDDTMAERITGVWGGLIKKAGYATIATSKGDVVRAAEYITPEFIATMFRAVRMHQRGVTTFSGRPVFGSDGQPLRYTGQEAIWRFFGFLPYGPSRDTQARWDTRLAKEYWSERKSDVLARIRISKDRAEAIRLVREFNAELRKAPGRVLVSIIDGRTVSQALRARPNVREIMYQRGMY